MSALSIELRHLPEEGLHREGKLPVAVLELSPDDPVRPISPVIYSLDIQKDEDELVAIGTVSADFELECGRCCQRFPFRLEIPDFVLEVPIENEAMIDLTEPLREDILLSLPSYPRCEDGNITPRKCPAEGNFELDNTPSVEAPPPSKAGTWDALDQLN